MHEHDHPHWNHNVHYHRVVLAAVPDGCRAAPDVGCGDGLPARKLATRAETVTGVDRSPDMIRLARENQPANVTFLQADYLDDISLARARTTSSARSPSSTTRCPRTRWPTS